MIRLAKPPISFEEVEKEIKEIINSGRLIEGKYIKDFEQELASAAGSKYSVAVSSGTTALHVAFSAIGIEKGDEVILPDYTFFSPANMIELCGAKPILADIKLESLNIDPEEIVAKITPKTKAILAIHQFGNPAEMNEIMKIADEKGLLVIEDAACSLGAKYKGKLCGGIGKAAAFSFHPRKIISTGEGGAVTTNDAELAETMKELRNHGIKSHDGKKLMFKLGFNYRATELAAAMGRAQLKKLNGIIKKRRELAEIYKDELESEDWIRLPNTEEHIYQSYVILVEKERDKLVEHLRKKGIEAVKGAETIHLQPYYQKRYGYKPGAIPKSYEASQKAITLPLHTEMSPDDAKKAVGVLKDFIK